MSSTPIAEVDIGLDGLPQLGPAPCRREMAAGNLSEVEDSIV